MRTTHRRSVQVFAIGLLSSTVMIASCIAAPPDPTERTGATSDPLLRCYAPQIKVCSNEGPGGSQLCWCEDPPPPDTGCECRDSPTCGEIC